MGRLIERDGIHYRDIAYEPLPSQRHFHQSTARFKGFSGPIGSGKSQALCHEAIKLAYINAGRTGLIGAPTYPMLRDATQATFLEVLETNAIPYTFAKSEGVLEFRDTGSKVLFRSMEEYERLRGTNIAWFGLDELTYMSEEAWKRLEGRLRDAKAKRLCGFAVWSPRGYDWVHARFIQAADARYDVTRAKAFENKHILDAVPDYYERLRQSYDNSFYLQEVLGEYLNTSGQRVYPDFTQATHVMPLTPEYHLPICWAMDFNVDPLCSIVAQIHGERVRVLDEIVLHRAITEEACEEFSRRYGGHAAGYEIYGDASGKSRSTRGNTDYEIVTAHFRRRREPSKLDVPDINPRVLKRIQMVNARLKSADGKMHMTIDPKCRELIQDLEQVCFTDVGTRVDKDKDRKRTHASDALGYLICSSGKLGPQFGEQHKPLLSF